MRIKVNKSWISARQIGPEDTEDVILISGFIGMSSFWDNVIPFLSKKYRLTIFDQRGTGSSGPFEHPLSMQQMTNDAELVLDSLSGKPVHLIGHSAGSGISIILAERRPEIIKSITLLAGWTNADAWMQQVFDVRLNALKNIDKYAYAQLTTLFMIPPKDVALHNNDLNKTEAVYSENMPAYENTASRAEAVLKFNSKEYIQGVNCPSFVMGARDDAMTPFYFSEELSLSLPHSQLYALTSGGHYFPRTRTELIIEPIINFLDKCAILKL